VGHIEDGTQLRAWLMRQKISKKKGRLDIERVTRLDEFGVVWDFFADQWENNYQVLCTFYDRGGNCNLPDDHVENGTKLGRWVSKQRESKKKGSLDTDRATRLDELGMFWNVLADQWENNYQLLCKFYDREGHCNVSHRYVENRIKLGKWVIMQRQSKRKEV